MASYLYHKSIQNFFKKYKLFGKLEERSLSKKYAFLYTRWWAPQTINKTKETIYLYMIHKIEIYPHYTFPTISHGEANYDKHCGVNNTNITRMSRKENHVFQNLSLNYVNDKQNLKNVLPPYRTVSHYGFNYPSTYMPKLPLQPVCSITSVDLQRQKVIAFIKRLNMEAQMENCSNNAVSSTKMENNLNAEKEENMYGKSMKNSLHNKITAKNTAGSFISVAEIQLSKAKVSALSNLNHPKLKGNHDHSSSKNINQIDVHSDQFSSLLSISGTYPAATHSHTGDAEHEQFTTDSGDNLSNFDMQSSRKNGHESLYRSYLQRNFIPETIDMALHHSVVDSHDDPHHDPHKPECEQLSQNIRHSSKYIGNDESKHVTLTLNSLKRRASSLGDKKESPSSKSKDKIQTSFRTQLSDLNSSCDSSTASTAIEIHINVNIRNSDCVRNLQNHEQEFKSKLEKIIDDEINLISQGLLSSPQRERDNENIVSSFHLNPSQRCLSAPESISLCGRDASCTEADRHSLYNFCQSAATTTLRPSLAIPSQQLQNLYNLRYRHTLAMLEHELEMLLNGIIRNMCDCKTKITQISEDIRTATLHVGTLNSTYKAKENQYK